MSRPDPLAIVVDRVPPKPLWPNSGAHKRTKEPHIATMKQQAASGAQNALVGRSWSWKGPIVLHIEVYWPTGQRRLDLDNIIGALKSTQDGIFTKLDADDRQVVGIMLTQDWDRVGDGYVVYLVEAVETEARAA